MEPLIFFVALRAWLRLTWRSLPVALMSFALLALALAFAPRDSPIPALMPLAGLVLVGVAQVVILQRWVFRKPFRSRQGPVELCVERDGGPEPHPLAAGIGWALWWGMTWRSMVLMAGAMLLVAVAVFGLHLESAAAGWLDRGLSASGLVTSMLGLAWLLRWPYGATRFSVRRCAGAAPSGVSAAG